MDRVMREAYKQRFLRESSVVDGTRIQGYRTEYAKSWRASCRTCRLTIDKATVRISKIDLNDWRDGKPIDKWYHPQCFHVQRRALGWFTDAKHLPGFWSLKPQDQMYLSDLLPALPVQQQVVIKTEPDLNDSGISVTPRRQERSTSRIRTHVPTNSGMSSQQTIHSAPQFSPQLFEAFVAFCNMYQTNVGPVNSMQQSQSGAAPTQGQSADLVTQPSYYRP